MDIAILCGGYGTRLAGLWDGPKCLVPLGDDLPILHHILIRVHKLRPRRIHLLTGYKSEEIITYLRQASLLRPNLLVLHGEPRGTATALRNAAIAPYALVLNGDTLPLYDLSELINTWAQLSTIDVLLARVGALPAGATILGTNALKLLAHSTETDFSRWLNVEAFNSMRNVFVAGFLDVGTPEGYALARRWKP